MKFVIKWFVTPIGCLGVFRKLLGEFGVMGIMTETQAINLNTDWVMIVLGWLIIELHEDKN